MDRHLFQMIIRSGENHQGAAALGDFVRVGEDVGFGPYGIDGDLRLFGSGVAPKEVPATLIRRLHRHRRLGSTAVPAHFGQRHRHDHLFLRRGQIRFGDGETSLPVVERHFVVFDAGIVFKRHLDRSFKVPVDRRRRIDLRFVALEHRRIGQVDSPADQRQHDQQQQQRSAIFSFSSHFFNSSSIIFKSFCTTSSRSMFETVNPAARR